MRNLRIALGALSATWFMYMNIYDILKSRAYVLNIPPPSEGYRFPKNRSPNFIAYYDRAVQICDRFRGEKMIYEHCEPRSKYVDQLITKIACNITEHGLQNPVLITRKGDGPWQLHPGKCRSAALLELGINVIPAIVVDHRKMPPPEEAAYEILSPEQFNLHFTGDIAPEFTYRGVRTPKKR